jgi:uncharacterized protein
VRRVVVDTNVWISALLNPLGAPARVLLALEAGLFTLIASEPLLAEIPSVLTRPRISRKYHLGLEEAEALVGRLRRRAMLVYPTGNVKLCRDPKDDMVIETAILGAADTLVTRDDDLKGDSQLAQLLEAGGIEVMTVRRFLSALPTESAP